MDNHQPLLRSSASQSASGGYGAAATPPSLSATQALPDKHRGFKACIARGETAFGMATVAINIADEITDLVVAVQFYSDEQWLWFWLVVTASVIATLVYAIIAAELLVDSRAWNAFGWDHQVPRWVRWPTALVLSKCVPFLNFMVEHTHAERQAALKADASLPRYESATFGNVDNDDDSLQRQLSGTWSMANIDRDALGRAGNEELDAIERSVIVQDRMRRSVNDHLQKYILFYVESAVAAAPQAIIQLVAITVLGRATTVQLISLAFSVLSITSKGFIVSRAYDFRVMTFKFALAAHDVFSTFYLFSTLFAVETVTQTDFFGIPVSWLGYVWLWKTAGTSVMLLGGMATMAFVLAIEGHHGGSWTRTVLRNLARLFSIISLGLVVAVPVLVIYEVLKLSFGNIYITIKESDMVTAGAEESVPLLVSFLERDDRERSRLRHLVASLVGRKALRDAGHAQVADAVHLEAFGFHEIHVDAVVATHAEPQLQAVRSAALDWSGDFSTYHVNVHLEVTPTSFVGALLARCVSGIESCFAVSWLIAMATSTAVGQTLAFLYPFVNAYYQYDTHNMLQSFCFYGLLTGLFFALLTLRPTWHYTKVCASLSPFMRQVSAGLATVAAAVAQFHQPQHMALLMEAVPVEVLPREVTAVAAMFLTSIDVPHNLTIEECAEIKQRWQRRDAA